MNNFVGEKPDSHKNIGTTIGTFCIKCGFVSTILKFCRIKS